MGQIYKPGRFVGVVTRTDSRERGFVFLTDRAGEEYFAHRSAFSNGLFESVKQGDGVSFRVTVTTKGQRAFDVHAATVEEQHAIDAMEESRGNR